MGFANYLKLSNIALLLFLMLAGSRSTWGRKVELMSAEDETRVDVLPVYYKYLLSSMVGKVVDEAIRIPPAKEGQLCQEGFGYGCEKGLQCRFVIQGIFPTFLCTKGNKPPPLTPPPASEGQLCFQSFPCERGLVCTFGSKILPICTRNPTLLPLV